MSPPCEANIEDQAAEEVSPAWEALQTPSGRYIELKVNADGKPKPHQRYLDVAEGQTFDNPGQLIDVTICARLVLRNGQIEVMFSFNPIVLANFVLNGRFLDEFDDVLAETGAHQRRWLHAYVYNYTTKRAMGPEMRRQLIEHD
jgi:hypothetical protein